MNYVRNPVLGLASAIVPGAGQAMKGQWQRVLLIWLGIIAGTLLFYIPGLIVYFWQIYDAAQ